MGFAQFRTLKMPSTRPASLTLQDNFRFFGDRVDKLTGGALKVDAMPAGQLVPAFEILDATHKKVPDGGHAISEVVPAKRLMFPPYTLQADDYFPKK